MSVVQFERVPSSGWRLLAGSVSLAALGAMSWLAVEYRVRSAAFDQIRSVGGVVIRDPAPLWVTRVLGSTHAAVFDRVVGVRLPAQGMSADALAESLKHLVGFDELMFLDLSRRQLDASAMKQLTRLASLRDLDLASTNVVDDDLRRLRPLRRLRNLCLADTAISDMGLAELVPLNNIEVLNLDGTRVTDRGMQHLARLPGLVSLSVSNTEVTEAGLAPLGGTIAATITDD